MASRPPRGEYIVGGVKIDGEFPKTKRELNAQIKDDPSKVKFFTTSLFGPQFADTPVTEVLKKYPLNMLSIAGPDPGTLRKWYATIKLAKDNRTIKVVD